MASGSGGYLKMGIKVIKGLRLSRLLATKWLRLSVWFIDNVNVIYIKVIKVINSSLFDNLKGR